ncbi:MAG: hypothetical protein JSS51_08530 [Planctomycetes bacterium]|nr:hypothetical protein [Planctomycetota bacterium]
MKLAQTIVCGLAIGILSAGALAQDQQPTRGGQRQPGGPGGGGPGGGGPGGFGGRQLSPDKAKSAWSMQATGVASRLGLNADQTKAVVSAYVAAREAQNAEAEKFREEAMKARENGGGPDGMRDMMKKMEEINASERDKLQKALTAAIGADATGKAMPSLGAFSRQWDNLVDVFSTFQLDAAKQQQGLNAIEEFATTSAAAQARARANRGNDGGQGGPGGPGAGGGDREAMRAAAQESRQKLMDALKPILNKEQMTKVEESLPGGGGGRGPGGGRRGGGAGGGGN